MKEFVARTDVNADPATGWRVLTDFALFPEWNPLLRRINGTASPGASLGLRVAQKPGSDKTMFLPAKIRVCNPQNELAWGGGVPGLLDVHHYFRFEPSTAGFRFIHGEIFRGALLPLLWPIIGARVRQENYETLNDAFKKRCEQAGARR
jgi:hypothetical protein